MLLSKVIEGYLLDAQARKLSQHTINDYKLSFRRFVALIGDVDMAGITVEDCRRFMASLSNLSAKTARNHYIGLSALWTWAKQERIINEHVWRSVKPPRPDVRAVQPFTHADIRALLRASVSISKERNGKLYTARLHMARRNKAIVLILLDTGVRASELCALRVSDFDAHNARIRVWGKGRRERLIDFSPITAKTIWRYLASREGYEQSDPLFTTDDGRELTRYELGHIIAGIGRRADVKDCYPHRFRHTFAVLSITNGVDPYTLQNSLGHSSMEMVRRYLNITQVDAARLQRKASPVQNLDFRA